MAARQLGTGCVGVGMDVRDEEDVARGVGRGWTSSAVSTCSSTTPGSACGRSTRGSSPTRSRSGRCPPDGFRDVRGTNLTGDFLVARAVVPRLLSAGGGRVVTVSTNHSTMNRKGFVPYGPSRSGAEALARVMAADLTGTRRHRQHPAARRGDGDRDGPGRLPDRAARAAAGPAGDGAADRWLCSPQAAGVHGERIVATEFAEWLSARTA